MKRGVKLILLFTLFVLLSACSSKTEEPPDAVVLFGNNRIEAVRGSYTWEVEGLFSNKVIHAEALAPDEIADEFNLIVKKVGPDAVAEVEFSDNSNPRVNAYLWVDGKRGAELATRQQQITLPSDHGKHIIEISAEWENGYSTYVFVIEVDEMKK